MNRISGQSTASKLSIFCSTFVALPPLLMTIADLRQQNLILFEAISGSRAYGTNLPHSDTDLKGVFVLPEQQFFGFDYIPQVANETNDEVFYELRRFVELLLKNNPTVLELLGTPADSVLYKHPLFDQFQARDYLSKLCRQSFAEYAVAQIRKAKGLNKKINHPEPPARKSVLDFCYVTVGAGAQPAETWLARNGLTSSQCGLANVPHLTDLYALFVDYSPEQPLGYRGLVRDPETSQDVLLSAVPKGEEPVAYLSFNRNGYSTYCRVFREYWEWVVKRNTERYENTVQHGKNYDAKNMLHVFRLLQMAEEIARTSELHVRRSNREFLLQIRRGEFEYAELLTEAEELVARVEAAFASSALPETPSREMAENTLLRVRREFYEAATRN
jgi:predicted nucleotidyltransferase